MKHLIIGILLVSLMLFGCSSPPAEGQNATNQTNQTGPPAVQVKTPSFTISTPVSGETITVEGDTTDVTLTLSTQNLVLKAPGGAAKKGEGHFTVSVDGKPSETLNMKTYPIAGLALGSHTIEVELVNNDGTPYSPTITKTVSFTVEKAKPVEYVPQTHTVTVDNSGFSPKSLTVKVKDSVTFVNEGASPQSATCFIDGKEVFDTDTIAPGKSATLTFDKELECEYYSQLFRMYTANITVVSNGVD